MFQLVIHGRGGQGAKTMAMILAQAVIESGEYAQAYPEFGPERTGAPVCSFLRVSSQKIITREPIRKPEAVVILDDFLFSSQDVQNYLKNCPFLVVNSSKSVPELLNDFPKGKKCSKKINSVDAFEIIADFKNKVHPTIPLIGRLIKVTEFILLEDIAKTIRKKFVNKIGEEAIEDTLKALEAGYYNL
jgi:pyruvate ferredoxin oxidoreductase gamma subunit